MRLVRPSRRLLVASAAGALIAFILFALLRSLVVPKSGVLEISWGTSPVTLLEPSWLYLLALVPYFYVVRVFALTDVSALQQTLAASLRALVFALVVAALARPVWITSESQIVTIALVDVSESVTQKQLEAAQKYVESLEKTRGKSDRVMAITFAESPRLALPTDGRFRFERHLGAGAGTNIEAAAQLAYGVVPKGYIPRLLVLSDGNETRGDIAAEAARAQSLGMKVSWQYFPRADQDEVRIVALKLPDEIKVGAPFQVVAEVWSNVEQEVTVFLRQDEFPNPLDPKMTAKLKPGLTRLKFKSQAKKAGHTSYSARIAKGARDTNDKNNSMVMTAPVKGRPNILYVEGGRGSSSYFKRALEHENMDVQVRGPRSMPASSKELQKFDMVVVSDVPSHFMGLGQMQALESYVRDLGGGFMMAGGQDSFGSGGYQGTRIERLLPVRFDSEKDLEEPSIAIMLVIDRSGSMQGAKIEAAKQSARATAEVLSPRDLIGVIGFDSRPTVIVRPQRASNRMRISSDISRLRAGGGTNIYPALQEAYNALQNVNAKVKHVILLSDGQASASGIADLCREMLSSRITVSAVGIGDAKRSLLKMITSNGGGRMYMTDNIAALPRIFMKETSEIKKSSLIEDLVFARIAKRVEMIEGTGVAKAPALLGYVSTKQKPTSEVVLQSDLGEPLLARWRYGTGTSVAWTSDIKNRWGANWVQWSGYPKFWAQVIRTSMRRKVYDSYDLSTSVDDGIAHVTIDAIDHNDQFVNELETTLQVIDPATTKVIETIRMSQDAAGRYSAHFALGRYGSFLLKAVHKRNGKTVAESLGSATLSYPLEYLSTESNTAALTQAAVISGGFHRPEPQQLFDAGDEKIEYTEDLWAWLLLLAALAFVVDTYLKRVRLFGFRADSLPGLR